jgi:acyl carrier protein
MSVELGKEPRKEPRGMDDDDRLAMKKRVQRLVYLAAGGKIREDELAQSDADLRQIGLDSLGYLNLLEGLERTFGVAIDLDQMEDHSFLHTIDNLVRYLSAQRGAAA